MSKSQPELQFWKLSDGELAKLASQPGLAPDLLAAALLEQAMRRTTPTELESYRAQALKEYAGLRASRRDRSLRGSRIRLWQARGFSAFGLAAVAVGLLSLLTGPKYAIAQSIVSVIFGAGMLVAGLVLASSAKAELAAFGRNR